MARDGDEPARIGEVECKRKTDKAILVDGDVIDDLTGSRTAWIPLSVLHDDSEVFDDAGNDTGTLVVKSWWAKKQGWTWLPERSLEACGKDGRHEAYLAPELGPRMWRCRRCGVSGSMADIESVKKKLDKIEAAALDSDTDPVRAALDDLARTTAAIRRRRTKAEKGDVRSRARAERAEAHDEIKGGEDDAGAPGKDAFVEVRIPIPGEDGDIDLEAFSRMTPALTKVAEEASRGMDALVLAVAGLFGPLQEFAEKFAKAFAESTAPSKVAAAVAATRVADAAERAQAAAVLAMHPPTEDEPDDEDALEDAEGP